MILPPKSDSGEELVCFEEPPRRRPPPVATCAPAAPKRISKTACAALSARAAESTASSGDSTRRYNCPGCERVFLHPPALASHRKACSCEASEAYTPPRAKPVAVPNTPTRARPAAKLKASARACLEETSTLAPLDHDHAKIASVPGTSKDATLATTNQQATTRFRLRICVPDDLVCAACTGFGRGDQMVRCHGGCASWVHECCAGLKDARSRRRSRPYICPPCTHTVAGQDGKTVSPTGPAASDDVADASVVADGCQAERTLLQHLHDDMVMESDLRRHLSKLLNDETSVSKDWAACHPCLSSVRRC